MADDDRDCLVCQKHRDASEFPGGPIYEDDSVIVSHMHPAAANGRMYVGWCLVETRRHVRNLSDLSDAEGAAVGVALARLGRSLEAELQAEHVYAWVLGDRLPHLQVHLVPRHPGTPKKFWGLRVHTWPDAPWTDEAGVVDLVGRLRARLALPTAAPRGD